MPLAIISLGAGTHTDTDTHTHTYIHTNYVDKTNLKKNRCMPATGTKVAKILLSVDSNL